MNFVKTSKRSFFPILLGLIGLAGICGLIYGSCLSHGFTNWDDATFLNHPAIQHLDLRGIFSQTLLSNYYPVTLLSLALDYRIGGGTPYAFHLTSILLHFLNAVGVAILAYRLFPGQRWLAWLSSMLFLCHPVQVEAVSWLAARNYPLSTTFILLALLSHESYSSSHATRRQYFLTIALSFIALLCKASAVILPALFLLLDHLNGRKNSWRVWVEKIPHLTLAAMIGWLTVQGYSTNALSAPEIFHLSLLERGIWAIRGVAFYLHHFLFPAGLSAYYDLRFIHSTLSEFISTGIFTGLIIFYLRAKAIRSRGATFGIAFFFLALLPSLKLIPFGEYSIFNDRYLYLPSIGLILFLLGVAHALSKHLQLSIAPWILIAAVITVETKLAQKRTETWRDGETLWKDVLQTYPETAMAHNNLGRIYLERGDWDLAKPEFEKARAARPEFDKPYYNLGIVAQHFKDCQTASELFKTAIRINPAYSEAYNNLGSCLSAKGDDASALDQFLLGIKSGATFPEIHYNAAWSSWRLGKIPECEYHLKTTLQLAPDFAPALTLLRRIHP